MALTNHSNLSEGEISGDSGDELEAISSGEDEYFKNITNEIQKRKQELELENALQSFYDNAKENRYEKASAGTSSGSKKSNNPRTRYKSELRNRSYRASSVFSSSISLPKRRRKSIKPQKKKATRNSRKEKDESSDDNSDIVILEEEVIPAAATEDDDEEFELIALRLNALKSKLELKELDQQQQQQPPSSSNNMSQLDVPEEELLRIDALKSALLKKKDHFRKKKQMRKLENERPYSPTDNLSSLLDDPMELSNSPIQTPFIELPPLPSCDDINLVDMEISNTSSPVGMPLFDEEEIVQVSSDMEIATSPAIKPLDEEGSDREEYDEDIEEERALRSMLLSSVKNRQTEEINLAKNLKLALERLRKNKKPPTPPPPIQMTKTGKSGTKTIKMLLEEKKNKRQVDAAKSEDELPRPITIDISENLLIEQILASEQNALANHAFTEEALATVESTEIENSCSAITDTKNIPLLPQKKSEETKKKKDSRVITSLESVKRIVMPLIISVNNADSSEDEYIQRKLSNATKKNQRKVVLRAPSSSQSKNANIEKQVDDFLKQIRLQSEKTAIFSPSASSTAVSQSKVKSSIVKINYKSVTPSAVNHLPKSSQIEYKMLVEKMKKLEEQRATRQKSRQLKRTKSTSSVKGESNNHVNESMNNTRSVKTSKGEEVSVVAEKKKETAYSQKIEDTFSKIPLLDKDARERFTNNAESKYLTHSKTLKESTDRTVKLVEEEILNIRRREKIESKIVELENSLAKYNSMKTTVEHRIHVGLPKIVHSQIALVKLRAHQLNFGKMCSRVGKIVRGDDYSLPDNGLTDEIQKNLAIITEKSEKVQSACNEHFAIKHLKSNTLKIKAFMKEEDDLTDTKDKTDDAMKPEEAPKSVYSVVLDSEESLKRSNEMESVAVNKKVKYESPLDFLKIPQTTSGDDNDDSGDNINRVVCPLALKSSSCHDNKCKMLHI